MFWDSVCSLKQGERRKQNNGTNRRGVRAPIG
jgi:hypothetical protein